MNILLLSTGGGGGNVLRSVKTLFERDLVVTQKTDPAYAERLRTAITARFLDTNAFSLSDLPMEERLLIGARTTGCLGARHNPDVARQALEESRGEVEAVIDQYSVVILIGTGGKGTGAGTIFPLAQMARQQKKLVLPIFVRPSFERHEVDKRRYDHALAVSQQFDHARIRIIEILNDRGYDEREPLPQSTVWERMNLPIARALRGLMYVLWDLSQVDPSDLSMLFAGHGRLRIGFGEIDPPDGCEPADEQVQQAIRECWENPYYAFGKHAGTSLICIQGHWSNVVDARIKGGLAAFATSGEAGSSYNPLYTRAAHSPKPWGVTALFGEFTGMHVPVEIEWSVDDTPDRGADAALDRSDLTSVPVPPEPVSGVIRTDAQHLGAQAEGSPSPPFASLWAFAVAVNRSDPAAQAIAGNGAAAEIPIDGLEVRKLLSTMWFRTVVPRLSEEWRARILEAFVSAVVLPNHVVKGGRHPMYLGELTYSQLQEVATSSPVPDIVRPDLDLLLTIGRLWGGEAVRRVRFTSDQPDPPSRFVGLLHGSRT